MTEFKLKKGFLIGVASAATQIEGGELEHSWQDWYRRGKIKDNSNPARANDHYARYQQDTLLMKEMGIEIYRLGIEWARIEPQKGVFDGAVIQRYCDEIKQLQLQGIKVLVTLHHFTNPLWFENIGAFSKKENISYFIKYIEVVLKAFGPEVAEYITINEPNVYTTFGYFFGEWPPGEKSLTKTIKVLSILAAAHLQAYLKIHEIRKEMGFSDTKVSFANHLRVFIPKDSKKLKDRFFTKLLAKLFQQDIAVAMMKAKFPWYMKNILKLPQGIYCDFIALNYYTRSCVSGMSDGVKENVAVNDLGWEIYPPGIIQCAQQLYDICQLPIYITENGTCDNHDSFRARYIYEHLKEISESSLPLARYYHWCFCDNFEWLEGESARFGIVHIDYDNQKRTIKNSGRFFSEIIANKEVTTSMYDKYVKDQEYPRND